MADRQVAAFSNRPVHSRRRAEVAHEEGRHAHHGWNSDHHIGGGSNAPVGESAESLCVDRLVWHGELWPDRFYRRLREAAAKAKPGAHGKAEVFAADSCGDDSGVFPADAAHPASLF